MRTKLETDMDDLITARRSGLISESEFDAAAAYLAKYAALPGKDALRYHIPAAPIPQTIEPKRRSKAGLLILILFGLSYLGSKTETPSTAALAIEPDKKIETGSTVKLQEAKAREIKPVVKKIEVAATPSQPVIVYPEVSQYLRHKLCKAGIATLFTKEPNIIYTNDMRGSKGKIDQVGLFYRRPDDNTLWEYKCFTYENRVVWGAHDGRWRTHPLDEPVYFKLDGDLVHIQVHAGTDGSLVTARTYNMNKL